MKNLFIFFLTVIFLLFSLSISYASDNFSFNLSAIEQASKIVGTYGLSVFLVLYYVIVLRKKEEKKYLELAKRFEELNRSYEQLRDDLRPEKRTISVDQTRSVGELGLDRDYYKLYKRMIKLCENWNAGKKVTVEIQISNYMAESILDTIKSWEHFTTPIGKLKEHFTDTKSAGKELSEILCNMVKSDIAISEKIKNIDGLLLNRVLDSKKLLNERLSIGDRRKKTSN